MNEYILELGKKAKEASKKLAIIDTNTKNAVLTAVAKALIEKRELIKAENKKDLEYGKEKGISSALLDRLELTDSRIDGMAKSLIEIANFKDPVGEILEGWKHPDGMQILKQRVPLGVIGMIFESRPNVTIDSAGLALKSSNAIILRGGSDAINSNKVLKNIFMEEGKKQGLPDGAVQLIENTDREIVKDFIRLNKYIDVIIPRGGKGLKNFIIGNATVPVIETGAGLCHIFVDESADIKKAIPIIENAKTQRCSTCNTIETLLVHENAAEELLPELSRVLAGDKVELRADEKAFEIIKKSGTEVKKSTKEDWETEYLELILSIKTVKDIEEAITHIDKYSTQHSEAILTENLENAEKFINEVDSAAVYINASTRFTDGGEFGYGGEIGISTQKLHSRGPMGIRELTTIKYIIRGNGQIRK
ncbi:Gamma-glutamyl phosphate reductase [Sebaldella termitidis]|jgi:glutamate-5-semialdehyde dehydrogenase|uniref:Gamma-glutamyl phosphate reductase n=1 Tax=Sebaldella termitidis (strain ATCC 33386 / NCTC 11300) TaxID=526218 RepID=D1AN44_SEBTE|nr:glutamate-5-semialdehyde dehydrogenase [Sebaldella termitidis]ACZ09648.1 gamma-glutamyl phosphate reductase [Sebaldella termitidis ATCC 33386]SUI24980.1 Gamma-glutamyl phosphate reductase [Sebaldella termitidis]